MLWVTWRQHRLQLLTGAAALGLLGLFLLLTGPGIASTFRTSGLARCLATPGRDCGDLSDALTTKYSNLQFLIPLFLIIPALVGLFWGAPLVARELEQGTHRFAWTQGVTRTRWISTKLAALTGAAVAGSALIAWAASWWSRPLVAASDDRLSPGVFDLRGVVPIAYTVFALALGVAVGILVRRAIPAMVATIAGYVAVRAMVELWARPHFAAALTKSYGVLGKVPTSGRGDWIVSTKPVDGAGRFMAKGDSLDLNVLSSRCPSLHLSHLTLPAPDAIRACIGRIGLHVQAT